LKVHGAFNNPDIHGWQVFRRLDAADYLEDYKVALPSEFVAWGESLGWEPLVLSEDAFFEADTFVYDFYRASFDEALWPEHENG
jgi:hypothetical protein